MINALLLSIFVEIRALVHVTSPDAPSHEKCNCTGLFLYAVPTILLEKELFVK